MAQTKPSNVQMSDKLYHGDVSGAEDALRCLVRGLEAEMMEWTRVNATLGPDERAYEYPTSALQAYLDNARQALAIWTEEQRAAQARVVARLRAIGGVGGMSEIADALEAEAWDALAW